MSSVFEAGPSLARYLTRLSSLGHSFNWREKSTNWQKITGAAAGFE
jgi:hypothetical protein